MRSNRITQFYPNGEREDQTPEAPAGFVAVPRAQLPLAAQHAIEQHQQLYQWAFTQAQAERRPADLDNDWLAQ